MTISGGNDAAVTMIPAIVAIVLAIVLPHFMTTWLAIVIGLAAGIGLYVVLSMIMGGPPVPIQSPSESDHPPSEDPPG